MKKGRKKEERKIQTERQEDTERERDSRRRKTRDGQKKERDLNLLPCEYRAEVLYALHRHLSFPTSVFRTPESAEPPKQFIITVLSTVQ
jgi:hypothetical protein